MRSFAILAMPVLVSLVGPMAPPSAAAGAAQLAGFVPVTAPVRVLDERHVCPNEGCGADQFTFDVNVASPPADAVAAAITITSVARDSSGGWVSVRPGGSPPVSTSNVNLSPFPGEATTNKAIVELGPGGTLAVERRGASALLVDVNGWFTSTSHVGLITKPARVFDSRGGQRFAASETRTVCSPHFAGRSAAFVNVTVVDPASYGYVTAWGSGSMPVASVANMVPGVNSNSGTFPVGIELGCFRLYASSPAHLIVDLAAVTSNTTDQSRAALLVTGSQPTRLYDSRAFYRPSAGLHRYPNPTGLVLLNVTSTDASTAGFVYNGDANGPSILNVRPGVSVAASVLTGPTLASIEGQMASTADSHLIIDVLATFAGPFGGKWPIEGVPPVAVADSMLSTSTGSLVDKAALFVSNNDGRSHEAIIAEGQTVIDSGVAGVQVPWPDCMMPDCPLVFYAHRSVFGGSFYSLPSDPIGTTLTVAYPSGKTLEYTKVSQVLFPLAEVDDRVDGALSVPGRVITFQCACANGGPGCSTYRWIQVWQRS